jgi:hypothetical protein
LDPDNTEKWALHMKQPASNSGPRGNPSSMYPQTDLQFGESSALIPTILEKEFLK